MKRSVQELAGLLGARVLGDESVMVSRISSIRSAGSDDLVFVEDEKNLRPALESRAAAVIAGAFARTPENGKALLICDQPRLAFARAAGFLVDPKGTAAEVHATAVVSASARLGKNVRVEACAVIGDNVLIGAGTSVGAGSVIGAETQVGTECEVYPHVTIYPGVRIGDRVVLHAGAVLGSDGFGYVRDRASGRYEKFPQVGSLIIEDDVEIGSNSTVDRGALDTTRIARGTKIDNLVHIGHNAQIGEDVVIAAQTGLSGSCVVEDGVIIGGQVGIADHVRIEAGTILGAQSGIPSRKVIRGKGVIFWGTPARPIREYLKQLAVLARLAKKD
jgi:UDP-3-O-[3-hydroxymyristoyl] glucosamine N-acyltransferase